MIKEINKIDVINDIRKIAAKLNTNILSEQEYVKNGGKYPLTIFDDYNDEISSFSSNLELAGLKYKV